MKPPILLVLAALALGAGSAAFSAPTAHHRKAPHPTSQRSKLCSSPMNDDILACSLADERTAQRHLDKSWREVMRYVYDEDGSDQHCRMLKASQAAWIAYRDAECGFYSADTGQLTEPNAANCRASLTEQRARELDTYPPNALRGAFVPLAKLTCQP